MKPDTNPPNPPFLLERQQIARQFSRAARTYDAVSQLQQSMSEQLLSRLPTNATGRLVDFGCGTGSSLVALAKSSPCSLMGFDLAEGMIEVARKKLALLNLGSRIELWVADLVASGLPDQSVDVVFSNAAIQWTDLPSAFTEMRRVLKPAGCLLVSTFGPATLDELRQAWLGIGDPSPHVHDFPGVCEIREVLEQVGFESPQIDSKLCNLTYPNARQMLQSLKQLGATNADSKRSPSLLGKEKFLRLCSRLEEQAQDGQLQVQFEPIFVRAFKN